MFHVKRAKNQFHEINPMHSSSCRVFHVKQAAGSSRGRSRARAIAPDCAVLPPGLRTPAASWRDRFTWNTNSGTRA